MPTDSRRDLLTGPGSIRRRDENTVTPENHRTVFPRSTYAHARRLSFTRLYTFARLNGNRVRRSTGTSVFYILRVRARRLRLSVSNRDDIFRRVSQPPAGPLSRTHTTTIRSTLRTFVRRFYVFPNCFPPIQNRYEITRRLHNIPLNNRQKPLTS